MSYFITTPIYYVNDVPHIGHAYTTIACDILSRFSKLKGDETYFLTGTDEHGQKVETSSIENKMDTISFTNKVSARFKDLTLNLNLTNNDFIRTTEERHKKKVQTIWKTLLAKNEIYLDNYEGWYSIRDECFINEKEISIDDNNNKIGPSKDILKKVKEPSPEKPPKSDAWSLMGQLPPSLRDRVREKLVGTVDCVLPFEPKAENSNSVGEEDA